MLLAEVRGENTPDRKFASNSQPPGHESDTLITELLERGCNGTVFLASENMVFIYSVVKELTHDQTTKFQTGPNLSICRQQDICR